jgi:aminoglycoside phosphotransferase (APT) family kinase protein
MSDLELRRQITELVRRIDRNGKLLRMWPLDGGVSAQMTAFEIVLPDGQTREMIARRHGGVDLEQNPNIAADEYRLLRILRSAKVPVPAPYLVDPSGEVFGRPALVLEYVEGKPEFAPADVTDVILPMAAQLTQIHRVCGPNLDLSFLPRQGKGFGERSPSLDRSLEEGRIREALESILPLPQSNEPVLLHGDFWPGNILWKNGQIVAVIDWEDARLGDPLSDVANSRLEVLWAFGIDAMHSFTRHYQSIVTTVDYANLPYWDLCAALRPAGKISTWGLSEVTENAMRKGHRWFVGQALEKLPALQW